MSQTLIIYLYSVTNLSILNSSNYFVKCAHLNIWIYVELIQMRNGAYLKWEPLVNLITTHPLLLNTYTVVSRRCVDWWCFGDKATSTTPTAPTTTTPPETTTPTTTPTTTTQSTSNTNWNYWLYLLRLLHRNRWWFG